MSAQKLSRDQVLDATLALAARSGLAGVTMRAVAAELSVTPMALYRHVGDKQGLLDGLVERLMREIAVPDQEDWRALLSSMARNMRAVACRYPDLFPLLFQRRAATEAAVGPREAVYRALRAAGLAEADLFRAELMISTFMLGFAASEGGGRFRDVDGDAEFEYAQNLIAGLIERAAQASAPASTSAAT